MHVMLIESTPTLTQFYMPNLCLVLQLLLDLTAGLDALKDVLTVLVQLQLGNDDLGWMDTERNGLSRGLLLDDTLDVDDVFETVDGGDLSLGTLVGATNDGNLIILSDWDGANLKFLSDAKKLKLRRVSYTYVVLFTELLAQRSAHDGTSDAGWGIEMSLAGLSPGGVEGCRKFSLALRSHKKPTRFAFCAEPFQSAIHSTYRS
ncbi:hypothetical protein EYC80_009488 [Monilinia laxa]|uniref:Uncharacterized protein n=1 Tax=Monilinia laxa TaxID=61186 RepID=A0A5N6JXZ4_MONLA|nr:hypothetical protein EYC80_009488 [Monilinia laxa]